MDVGQLFEQYKDDVYRLAVSYTRSPQEAADICQTVFLKLLEQPRITPGKEKSWLMQVTANQCRNLLRSAWWKRTQALEDTVPCPESGEQDVRQAVMCLPPQYRVVVYLYYYEGYSTEEIGKLLKLSRTAVTTRLARAREKIKDELKEA